MKKLVAIFFLMISVSSCADRDGVITSNDSVQVYISSSKVQGIDLPCSGCLILEIFNNELIKLNYSPTPDEDCSGSGLYRLNENLSINLPTVVGESISLNMERVNFNNTGDETLEFFCYPQNVNFEFELLNAEGDLDFFNGTSLYKIQTL